MSISELESLTGPPPPPMLTTTRRHGCQVTIFRMPSERMQTQYGIVSYGEWCSREMRRMQVPCHLEHIKSGAVAVFRDDRS